MGAGLSPGRAEVGGKGEVAGSGVSLCFSWPPQLYVFCHLRFVSKIQVAVLDQAQSTAKPPLLGSDLLPVPLGSWFTVRWTAGARLPRPWASPASASLGEPRAGDSGRARNPNPGFSLSS